MRWPWMIVACLSLVPVMAHAQTPAWAHNSVGDPSTANAANNPTTLKIPLAHVTRAGNAILGGCYWGSATATISTPTDDKSNSYTLGTLATDSTNGARAQAFYAPNVAAGTQVITVVISVAVTPSGCHATEFFNIATTTPGDGTGGRAVTGSNGVSINLASAIGANGDLIYQFGTCTAENSTGPFSVTYGSGFTALDVESQNVVFSQYSVASGATNPSFSQATCSAGVSSAVALKAASAGSDVAAGIKVQNIQQVNFASTVATGNYTFQFPTSGNLLVLFYHCDTNADCVSASGVSSSPSNTWTKAACSPVAATTFLVCGYYAANATTSNTMTVTANVGTSTPSLFFALVDIKGAATSPFDKTATSSTVSGATSGAVAGASITPSTSNGLVVSYIQEDSDSACGGSPGVFNAGYDAVYNSAGYNQDYGLISYENPNTSTVNISWTYCDTNGVQTIGNTESLAIAFEAPAAGPVTRNMPAAAY